MGADYEGQEKAIEILSALPNEAKEYLAHHMGNAISGAIGNLCLLSREPLDDVCAKRVKVADECLWHAVADLRRIGC